MYVLYCVLKCQKLPLRKNQGSERSGLNCVLFLSLSLFIVCFQAAEGPGLAFIMYSEAIKNMPVSQLWSVLYFSMLLLLGIGSMLGNITAIITPLRDFKIFSRLSTELLNGNVRAHFLVCILVCILCVALIQNFNVFCSRRSC